MSCIGRSTDNFCQVETLARSPFPQRVEFVVSADRQSNPRDLRPDIGMRILLPGSRRPHRSSTYVEAAYDNINTALCMEVKYRNTDDSFDSYYPDNPHSIFEATSSGSRGQLAMYADHQFRHQRRLFLSRIVIISTWARFIHWDRSGARRNL